MTDKLMHRLTAQNIQPKPPLNKVDPLINISTALPRSFFDRSPITVAQALIGHFLVCEDHDRLLTGHIVETEAYLADDDPASHAYRGQTKRNAAMFGPPGYAYIYAIHRYHCLNAVTEAKGRPSAVLIRALEPHTSHEIMAARRNTDRYTNLTSGPGKLCQAFAINSELNKWDLTLGQRLWLSCTQIEPLPDIVVTPRVGVTSARQAPLRFYASASSCVSRGPRTHRS